MEEKILELLNKMYNEFSGRFDGIENRLDGVENRLDGVENRLTKVETLIENDIKNDINALYDGYKLIYEKVESIGKTVNEILVKVDKHDAEICLLKSRQQIPGATL